MWINANELQMLEMLAGVSTDGEEMQQRVGVDPVIIADLYF